ncbi:MAG: efflux RND transporter periplasmic adaptor subunit [Candidatus Binatia bacterium]
MPSPTLAVLGLAAALLATSCRSGSPQPEEAQPTTTPIRVVVARPTLVTGDRKLVLPGTVEAWESARLFAQQTGVIETVSVDIGDTVERGAEIARILVPEMVGELRSAEAHVQRENAELGLARLTRERLSALRHRNEDALARQDVDMAIAAERVEAAQVAVAEAELHRLKALEGYATVRAPFSGRVTRRFLHPGDVIRVATATGAEPVVEMMRTERLRVVVYVPESAAAHARPGTRATVRLDAFPGAPVEATVTRVAGALDESTRSMRAEIDIENAAGRYEPGMYASVTLSIAQAAGLLRIPSTAIRGEGSDRFCLVARRGVLERAPVRVAADDGSHALVSEGLSVEDTVMVGGSVLAREGSPCEIVEEKAP